MKKVAIYTLGCRANQLESSIIADKFTELGWEVVDFKEKSDVYVINSCTVTSKSDNESRYYVRKARKTSPDSTIILCGCYPQVAKEEASSLAEVDFVFGNSEKINIAEFITNLKSETLDNRVFVENIAEQKIFKDSTTFSASGRTRANIKIQDGCNFRCSYCIIPYARGKCRSNKLGSVISQVKTLTEKGFKEIVLTGIHLGQWGLDFSPQSHLSELLKKLEEIKELKRYRLGSIDPMEVTPEFVKIIANSQKFCRHLHISLQSGNNEILKKMKRRYTVEYYSDLINSLAEKIPDISIGSDIIVGFPSETDAQFENTFQNLASLPISYIHVFSYSKREGTPAAIMPDQISENIKKERNKILSKLAKDKNLEFRKKFIGKELEVLFEFARDKKTGCLKGVSDNFITVEAQGDDSMKNKLLPVKIMEVKHDSTFGIIQ